MSKLEPGCKAIVIGGKAQENLGKIVTCIKFIGEASNTTDNCYFGDKDIWEIDTPIVFLPFRNMYPLCSARTLQRIDDHSEILTLNRKLEESV